MRGNARAFALLAILSFPHDVSAERRFTALGAGRGLEATVVPSMLVDRDGFLWVGSREGLFRYDGFQAASFLPAASPAA
jgi:ligand-binding sensor domain-containing protein